MIRPIAPGVTLTGVEFAAARRDRRERCKQAPARVRVDPLAGAVAEVVRATGLPAADAREALAAGRSVADLVSAFGRADA